MGGFDEPGVGLTPVEDLIAAARALSIRPLWEHSDGFDWDSPLLRLLIRCAQRGGMDPMPWQVYFAAALFARGLNGDAERFLHRWAVMLVPRQSGKTTFAFWLILAWMLMGKKVAYTAQSRAGATRRWEENVRDLLAPACGGRLEIRRSNGREYVRLPQTGGECLLLTPTDSGPRGEMFDGVFIDEAFDLEGAFEGAILPTMRTRPNAQMVLASSAGTWQSTLLIPYRDKGRAGTDRVLHMEWAAREGVDVTDPDTWAGWVPALDSPKRADQLETMLADVTVMDGERWDREVGNRWPPDESGRGCIDMVQFESCESAQVMHDSLTLTVAVAVNRARDHASVCLASVDGDELIWELVESRPGPTTWTADLVQELVERHDCKVAVDGYGASGLLAAELAKRGVPLIDMNSKHLGRAFGLVMTYIADGKLVWLSHDEFKAAAEHVGMRRMGQGFYWREHQPEQGLGVPITCIEAATVAGYAAITERPKPLPGILFGNWEAA